MTQIFVPDFFPIFNGFGRRSFLYEAEDGSIAPFKCVVRRDAEAHCMRLDDYGPDGVWRDTWFFEHDLSRGLIETRQDTPQENELIRAIWGPVKKRVLGEPILWGDEENIGETKISAPTTNIFRSNPPMFGHGIHSVTYEAIFESLTFPNGMSYRNILQLSYKSRWDGAETIAARYWMAELLGPVAVQAINYDSDGRIRSIGSRMDAIVTSEGI